MFHSRCMIIVSFGDEKLSSHVGKNWETKEKTQIF